MSSNIVRRSADAELKSPTTRPLLGKRAVVTGSTSGIGLGIARALAEAGANILFNGFGDRGEINKITRGIAEDFEVATAYSSADMSKFVQSNR